ncbi:putative thioredoxin family redox-active protein [Toxoplasma gondii MAS]|uniref:Putative thioredoxin family redox-active protein n=2 Tax=Toxoplasma gondii TaxID=5811 RepID=A0A086QHA9_TOXGO|nr:putative thioredoxin family redox-active protein [Toxoplasma gondii MAS]PUA90137.1 putative thioredoxin family redox-active protein [Toxoplasma gondii TgCATBr9]
MGVLFLSRDVRLAQCASEPCPASASLPPYNPTVPLPPESDSLVLSAPAASPASSEKVSDASVCSRSLCLAPSAPALDGKYVGLFFGAAWCPACKSFTSALVRFYNCLKPTGMFEVVYVPLDRNVKEYRGFVQTMPWYALPLRNYGDLLRKYKIRSLPALVLITPDDAVMTGDAVELVKERNAGEKFTQIFERFSGPASLGNRFRTLFC